MRFSSIFQLPIKQPVAIVPAVEERADETPPAPALKETTLPEALDERVRLVGEWQLGEA